MFAFYETWLLRETRPQAMFPHPTASKEWNLIASWFRCHHLKSYTEDLCDLGDCLKASP